MIPKGAFQGLKPSISQARKFFFMNPTVRLHLVACLSSSASKFFFMSKTFLLHQLARLSSSRCVFFFFSIQTGRIARKSDRKKAAIRCGQPLLSYALQSLCLCFLNNPVACIYESFDPRSNFVLFTVSRVVRPQPRTEGTFQVRHHGQVTTIF
jgi:hypothetical protein